MKDFNIWRYKFSAQSFISLIIIIFLFTPILKSSYVSDDAYRAHYAGLGFSEFLKYASVQSYYWWQSSGRIFLVSPIADVLPIFIFNNLADYKFYCYIVNVFVVLAFVRLVFMLYGRKVALVFPAFMALVFQLRDYHDAALAFGTLYQVTFLFVIFSAFCALRYGKSGGVYLWASTFFLLLALVTMEVAYSLIPFLLYVIGRNGDRNRLIRGLFSYSIVAIVVIIIGRYGLTVGDDNGISRPVAYTPNFDISIVVTTFAKQVFAGLPLSYVFFRPQIGSWGVLANPFVVNISFMPWVILLLLCGFVFIQLMSIERNNQGVFDSASNIKEALLVFLLIGIFPASVISFSSKYQAELVWGNGYLPVYIQYFGVATAASIVFASQLTRFIGRSKFIYFALVIFVVIFIGVNSSTNWRVVFAQEKIWNKPMLSDELILKSSEAKILCQGLPLFVFRGAPWVTDDASFVGRMGVSSVMKNQINIEGIGCVFASAFSSANRVAELVGPVRFENGYAVIIDGTRRLTGTSNQPLIETCDDFCSKVLNNGQKE